eukprot:307764-Prymnesium_polylepis.2
MQRSDGVRVGTVGSMSGAGALLVVRRVGARANAHRHGSVGDLCRHPLQLRHLAARLDDRLQADGGVLPDGHAVEQRLLLRYPSFEGGERIHCCMGHSDRRLSQCHRAGLPSRERKPG